MTSELNFEGSFLSQVHNLFLFCFLKDNHGQSMSGQTRTTVNLNVQHPGLIQSQMQEYLFLVQRCSEQVNYKSKHGSSPRSPSMNNETEGIANPKCCIWKQINNLSLAPIKCDSIFKSKSCSKSTSQSDLT